MRIALRFLGIDLFDFTVETDDAPTSEPGDATSNPVGFSIAEHPPEFPLLDRE